MHTEVTHRTTDTAVVIYVDGDLTTNTSPDVEAEVLDLIAGQAKHVIINVEKVNFKTLSNLRKRGRGPDKPVLAAARLAPPFSSPDRLHQHLLVDRELGFSRSTHRVRNPLT
jgi:hypothetical protein